MQSGQLVAGRYRLLNTEGAGGGGMVWRARDEQLGRIVALKQALPAGDAGDANRVRRLRREANLLASVNHPHIVTVYDLVADEGQWWMILEYVPAHTLAVHSPIPAEQAIRYAAQLASALEALHANGIVHRDVKPGNVLITDDGRAKLADLGISRDVRADETITDDGHPSGTPKYMAPEVASGHQPGAASDMFGLGATLFAAVEGHSPYGTGDDARDYLRRAIEARIETPRRAGELTGPLTRLLRADPAQRPTAAQFLRDVTDLVPAALLTGLPATPRRSRAWSRAGAAVAAIVVLVAAGGWLLDRASESDAEGILVADHPGIGDPRTADPCALLTIEPLGSFGDAEVDPEYGNFDRCDVLIEPDDGGEIDVRAQLDDADADEAGAPTERIGRVGVITHPDQDGECARTLVPPDGYAVHIVVSLNDGPPTGLCEVADAATDAAAGILNAGELPRRSDADPASLSGANACELIDPGTLEQVVAVDAAEPRPGFADWQCRWSGDDADLTVRFDRNEPLSDADGEHVTLAGRDAYRMPERDGPQSCAVSLVHREYTGASGQPIAELLLVSLSGPQSMDDLCDTAGDVAEQAVPGLPAA